MGPGAVLPLRNFNPYYWVFFGGIELSSKETRQAQLYHTLRVLWIQRLHPKSWYVLSGEGVIGIFLPARLGPAGSSGQRLWPLSLPPIVASPCDWRAFFLFYSLSFQGWSSAQLTVALLLCLDSARLLPWGLLDLSAEGWPSDHLLQELVLSLP